jgi:hypothetical protein
MVTTPGNATEFVAVAHVQHNYNRSHPVEPSDEEIEVESVIVVRGAEMFAVRVGGPDAGVQVNKVRYHDGDQNGSWWYALSRVALTHELALSLLAPMRPCDRTHELKEEEDRALLADIIAELERVTLPHRTAYCETV